MKYRMLLWVFLLGCCVACSKDDEIDFDIPVEFRQISFEPVPGGAVMRYKLPVRSDIFGVRVRYTSAYGEELMKDGSYLSDSLLLTGFTEARTAVPARISFFNKSMQETAAIEKTFDTGASACIALFDNLEIKPFWGGFNVTYQAPETVDGMIYVFYVGEDPRTHEPDSILMGGYPIKEGGDTLNFVLKDAKDKVDVVIRADDFSGHRVKTLVKSGMPCLVMRQLDKSEFDYKFMGEEQKNDEYAIGPQYLFDGKKKGESYRKNYINGNQRKYCTYFAGPDAYGKRFIIDLKEQQVPAAIRLQVFLNLDGRYDFPGNYWQPATHPYCSDIWNGYYYAHLPSEVYVYGTNEDPETVDLQTCIPLFSMKDQNDYEGFEKSWCRNSPDRYSNNPDYLKESDAVFDAADEVYLEMLCNFTEGVTCRYLIFRVMDTYDTNNGTPERNQREFITFDELEVFVRDVE